MIPLHRVRASVAWLSVLLFGTLACTGTTDPEPAPEPAPREPGEEVASLSIDGPRSLLVHEQALVEATPRDASGDPIEPPWTPVFWSGDTTVAVVSYAGVVRAVGRGTAMIHASVADVPATLQIEVGARLHITPGRVYPWGDNWQMVVGDTLQFVAEYVDVDGWPIDEIPAVTWNSDNPAGVSVSPDGEVTALQPYQGASIVAAAPDGADTVTVLVSDVVAGLPAGVRFVHGARFVGPVTFVPSKGDPVTLDYGESLEVPITSGTYYVRTEGLTVGGTPFAVNYDYAALVEEGQHLSLYAVGAPEQGFLAVAWDAHDPVADGTGLVRLVQGGSDVGIFYLRPLGGEMAGLPELCYFDPGTVSNYYTRDPGDFDIILQKKLEYEPGGVGSYEIVRFTAATVDGNATTFVIAGTQSRGFELLTFPDP